MYPIKRTRLRASKPVEITCKKCNYKWWTRSLNRYVLCPRCHHPNKNPQYNEYIKALIQIQQQP